MYININEGNKMIASSGLIPGMEKIPDYYIREPKDGLTWFGRRCEQGSFTVYADIVRETDLVFDKSLDAILPALTSIEKLGHKVNILGKNGTSYCYISYNKNPDDLIKLVTTKNELGHMAHGESQSKPAAVFMAVVEFLQWMESPENIYATRQVSREAVVS